MKFHLIPDSRRPYVFHIAGEDDILVTYPDGCYVGSGSGKSVRWRYVPSAEEKRLRRDIEAAFPDLEIFATTPAPGRGRFEGRHHD